MIGVTGGRGKDKPHTAVYIENRDSYSMNHVKSMNCRETGINNNVLVVGTAKSVALRCDLPLKKILYMPVGTNWIFRRGQLPVNGKNFDLDAFERKKQLNREVARAV